MAIADRITKAKEDGQKVYIEDSNGVKQELIFS